MNKRKDECLFCSSRKCSTRIYRRDVPIYDELACDKHIKELEKHAEETLGKNNGILRHHVSGTGTYRRGEVYRWEIEEAARELIK